MVNSNPRKLALSGWLKNNGSAEYGSALKLQKFLLLYESLSKVKNDEGTDFNGLKGYKRGPVFSTVWGDYTYERTSFDAAADRAYRSFPTKIDEDTAKKSQFIVQILSESELSDLTHKMNIWKSKESRIMRGEHQVDLSESDFNGDDVKLVGMLDRMYPLSLIENSRVVKIDNYAFLLSKEDAERLTEQHYDVLSELVDTEELANPVFIQIDEEGRLLVD